MAQKFISFITSALGTVLPCVLAGSLVGFFFPSAFWYCVICIGILTFFYSCLDRIPVRLYAGARKGLPLWQLLKYGYASTDKRPLYYYGSSWWLWRHWFYNK